MLRERWRRSGQSRPPAGLTDLCCARLRDRHDGYLRIVLRPLQLLRDILQHRADGLYLALNHRIISALHQNSYAAASSDTTDKLVGTTDKLVGGPAGGSPDMPLPSTVRVSRQQRGTERYAKQSMCRAIERSFYQAAAGL